jgi:Mrp family chromosome partitioning ATPase
MRLAGFQTPTFAQETKFEVFGAYEAGAPEDSLYAYEDRAPEVVPFQPDNSQNGAHSGLPARRTRPLYSRDKGFAGDSRARLVQNQCLKMSLGIFNRSGGQSRSLGFTSAIPGEGKTFLATVTASALAERGRRPVTLVDCNWDNPALSEHFGIASAPGLAEWLRLECDLSDIRRTISPYLTVIPSGNAFQDAMALAWRLREPGMSGILSHPDELLIADLPSLLTTDFGKILTESLDAVLLVVRAGVTQEAYVAEANRELANAALEGTVLNATRSAIPRWLQRLL